MDSLKDVIAFLTENWILLEKKLFEHIVISVMSLGVAMGIGIPVGVIMRRVPILMRPLMQTASVLQTIPSLALLAILVPVMGIGSKPTIVALVAYSLLPIIQNTYVGLTEVSKGYVESARSLGISKWQVLFGIELPLAMPTILAGVRTSTAMIIGITTIAALIGAGGLGDFITQGLALNDTQLILLGAIPATILALLADYTTSHIEDVFFIYKSEDETPQWTPKIIIGGFALIILYLFGNYFYTSCTNGENDTVRVATKNFTEQIILGEIISQLIEDTTDLKVTRKFNLGNTAFVHSALMKDEIDLYPEYSGTAYLNVLKERKKLDSKGIYKVVEESCRSRFGLIWLSPLGYSNSNSLAVRKEFATDRALKTISDLNKFHGQLVIGAPPEFVKRADALPGLVDTYGLKFKDVQTIAPDLVYKAIVGKEVDVVMAFTTDGKIVQNNLTVLRDDLKFFPSYQAGIVVRKEALKKHPKLEPLLLKLSGKLTESRMRTMNLSVDSGEKTPKEVAAEFLRSLK